MRPGVAGEGLELPIQDDESESAGSWRRQDRTNELLGLLPADGAGWGLGRVLSGGGYGVDFYLDLATIGKLLAAAAAAAELGVWVACVGCCSCSCSCKRA